MTLLGFFTTEFTVKRQVYVGAKSALSEVDSFYGHIQQSSPDAIAQLGLTYSNPSLIWCAVDEDVHIGDQLEDDSYVYTIEGIQLNNVGANKHLELSVSRAFLKQPTSV